MASGVATGRVDDDDEVPSCGAGWMDLGTTLEGVSSSLLLLDVLPIVLLPSVPAGGMLLGLRKLLTQEPFQPFRSPRLRCGLATYGRVLPFPFPFPADGASSECTPVCEVRPSCRVGGVYLEDAVARAAVDAASAAAMFNCRAAVGGSAEESVGSGTGGAQATPLDEAVLSGVPPRPLST